MNIEINNFVKFLQCPMCGSIEINKLGSIPYQKPLMFSSNYIYLTKNSELWKCKSCLSCFSQNILPEKTAYDLYSNNSSSKRWSNAIFEYSKSSDIINELIQSFKKGYTILDIGCNTGLLLDFAKKFECITSGIEPSRASQLELKNKGHKVFSSLESIENESLNIITAFDLVEHVYDLPKFLNKCFLKLKKNGVMIILTGNVDSLSFKICKSKWWYVGYPEHIIFPSKIFFKEMTPFKLKRAINTYASIGYKKKLYNILHIVGIKLLRKNYNGLPSIGPDHHLLVLKK